MRKRLMKWIHTRRKHFKDKTTTSFKCVHVRFQQIQRAILDGPYWVKVFPYRSCLMDDVRIAFKTSISHNHICIRRFFMIEKWRCQIRRGDYLHKDLDRIITGFVHVVWIRSGSIRGPICKNLTADQFLYLNTM